MRIRFSNDLARAAEQVRPALAALRQRAASLAEVPVNHRARQRGISKYGIGRTVRVILDLITVKFLLSYSTQPMQIFGKWGFYSLLAGLLSFLVMVCLLLVLRMRFEWLE